MLVFFCFFVFVFFVFLLLLFVGGGGGSFCFLPNPIIFDKAMVITYTVTLKVGLSASMFIVSAHSFYLPNLTHGSIIIDKAMVINHTVTLKVGSVFGHSVLCL